MVKAVNDAGEAQSIADLVIGELIVEPVLKPAIQVDTEHIEQTNVSIFKVVHSSITNEMYCSHSPFSSITGFRIFLFEFTSMFYRSLSTISST